MKNPLKRLFKRAQKSVGGAWPLPITGGAIPFDWNLNFWQQGKDPVSYGETAIVSACVDSYAQTIASMRGYHNKYKPDDTKTRITNSNLAAVLNNPNSYQTRSDLFLNLVKHLLLKGNVYMLAGRDDRNRINALHLLDPRGTMPYVDPDTQAVFYAAGDNPLLGKIKAMIPARDVCHIRLYTPRHPLIGVSPIENAAMSIAANAAISGHQAAFFSNMSRPSGVLSTEMKLTADQMKQLRAAWEEQSKSMNSGGIPILGNGIKWEPMSVTSNDAQMVDAFNMTIEDVARAFRVPLPLVNDNRNSTYNNVEQLIAHWLSGGLGFLLDHIENNLDKFFGLPVNERAEFDVDTLLRTDFAGRIEGYTKSIQSGLMSPNEARAKMGGLPAVEFGDTPIVQQQMVPLGWTESQPEPVPLPEPDPEAEKSANILYLKKAMKA